MKITLITPSYNAEETIEKTILSILRQKDDNVQYIVIDGGSTDKTLEIVSKYQNDIDVIISEKDEGIADAYNKGISLATGDLIGIIAANDQLINNALDKIKKAYNGYSDVICGNIIDYNGERYLRRHSDANLKNLSFQTSLMHPATFIKKEAYLKYGKYSLKYKCAIDRELFLRFYKMGATFQIIDIDISFFVQGGISTQNPCKYAYPEDAQISIKYGTPILQAKMHLYKAVLQYYISRSIKNSFKKLQLMNFLNNRMVNKGYYISEDQIEKLNIL
jgi:glycosyltransferase involved in cell wall biosynthesis